MSSLIGVILYILYINPIGFPGEVTLAINNILVKYLNQMDNIPNLLPTSSSLPSRMNSAKIMDDATIQEAIDLKTCLATKLDRSGPLPWWESSGEQLPNQNTYLDSEIKAIKAISDEREMVLNAAKTKLFIVNFTMLHQYQSLLTIPGSVSLIELTFKTKLFGYWLTTDIKPDTHVSYIIKIVYSRLRAITKLKVVGVSDDDILYFFNI